MLHQIRFGRTLAAALLVLAVSALSSCGFNFATDEPYTPAPGANDRDSRVDVLNGVIVAGQDGKGTFLATLVNNEKAVGTEKESELTDTLTGIGGEVTGQVDPKHAEIPAGGRLVLEGSEGTGIVVTGDFALGDFVTVELEFENADPVELEVPVVCNSGHFEGQDMTTDEVSEACATPSLAPPEPLTEEH